MSTQAIEVERVTHHYGERRALDSLSLSIPPQSIFGILGPNGSGKSTLFRLLSTLAPIQSGEIHIFGSDVRQERSAVRRMLGVVFQSPSLDIKLTVLENIQCQAALYGLRGPHAKQRISESLELFGLTDRTDERCEKLSGGLKRRVELAKGILHQPPLMILDEPSVGLDPAARLDLWKALVDLRSRYGTTVVLTTHLLEEAEKCDQLAIMHQGTVVGSGTPDELRQQAGDAMLTLTTKDPQQLSASLKREFNLESSILSNEVRVLRADVVEWVSPIAKSLASQIDRYTIARPSLEDVFVARTGHRFWDESSPIQETKKR